MIGWLSWCIWRRKEQPYVWKCVGFIVGLQLLLGLELGDFPPILWTFDAHSLWHAGTAPLCLLWYRYVDNLKPLLSIIVCHLSSVHTFKL